MKRLLRANWAVEAYEAPCSHFVRIATLNCVCEHRLLLAGRGFYLLLIESANVFQSPSTLHRRFSEPILPQHSGRALELTTVGDSNGIKSETSSETY
jgi:hypothetical protein